MENVVSQDLDPKIQKREITNEYMWVAWNYNIQPVPGTFVLETENRGSNAANWTDLEGIGLLLQELVTTLGCLLFTLVDLLGHPRGSNLTGHGELLYYSSTNRGIGRCRGYRPVDKSWAIPSLRSEEITVNLDARLRYYRSWRVDVPEAKNRREDDDERISTFVQPNGPYSAF